MLRHADSPGFFARTNLWHVIHALRCASYTCQITVQPSSQNLSLASVSGMVESTRTRHQELKDQPTSSTWFKDHITVFSDPKQLGCQNIIITEPDRENFISNTYRPYIQSVIDHISNCRLQSSDIYLCFSMFDPHLLRENEDDL